MAIPFKTNGLRKTVAVCALIVIGYGLGWLQSRNEIQKGERRLVDFEQQIRELRDARSIVAAEPEQVIPRFEIPNGEIRFVDPSGRKVWVTLGEDDGLRTRSTFSVYKKPRAAVGRDDAKIEVGVDTKGTIEITRILEAHLAEARILSEDQGALIKRGDPVFSPQWSREGGDAFSVVGIMDLDGDGRDDRDLFREVVATAGGSIDNDVDPQGVLHVDGKVGDQPRITARTKFVVIGKMPENADRIGPGDLATTQRINECRNDLVAAARERGVRVVSLSDFLKYLGYKS